MTKFDNHLKTLNKYIPPIVNVNCVIYKRDRDSGYDPDILVWYKTWGKWSFPWWRLKATEQPQQAAMNIIDRECQWIQSIVKRLITAQTDDRDIRSWNLNLYYLCEYVSWEYRNSDTFVDHQWMKIEQIEQMQDLSEYDRLIVHDIAQAISLVNLNQDEMLVEVDENNHDIGVISKREAHSTITRHHRAAHIFLFSSRGEVILQQRGRHVSSYPLKRDMYGWHQAIWQTIEQCARAELSEEVGIVGDLIFHHSLHFRKDTQSEFASVYTIINDGPYGYDRNEVEQLHTFDCQKIIDGQYDAEYDILPRVKTYLIELEDIRKPLII